MSEIDSKRYDGQFMARASIGAEEDFTIELDGKIRSARAKFVTPMKDGYSIVYFNWKETEDAIYSSGDANHRNGCGKELADGQWWHFCGETDMGQTMPALCTECGGDLLRKPQNQRSILDTSKMEQEKGPPKRA